MAYISAEDTKKIRKALKERFPKTKFAVRNHNHNEVQVVVKATDVPITFANGGSEKDINHYHLDKYPEPEASFYREILRIMNTAGSRENFDKSDIMTDYFHVGYWVNITVGEWKKPFVQL